MDAYQGEVFQLYIVQNKTSKDVREILKQNHGLEVSPKVFKTKTSLWGYTKNIKRSEVKKILLEKKHREAKGKESSFFLGARPVDLNKIERHRRRSRLPDFKDGTLINKTDLTGNLVCRTPPPTLPVSLPIAERWRVHEKFLFDVDNLIKGSFESGIWNFNGNERIITSSPVQPVEVQALHEFIGGLRSGCDAAEKRDYILAGTYWNQAFIPIEALVRGKYHDIIPNMIQKINDLDCQKLGPVAEVLRKHIANCGRALLPSNDPKRAIFMAFADLEMCSLLEIEQQIMKHFGELFELYLGPVCYGSFVMMMDGARRKLLQNNWASFDCLPSLSHFDAVFGPTNRRSLDIIWLRVEILKHREAHELVEVEASDFIRRADLIEKDEWQRLYNLTGAWFFFAHSQYKLGRDTAADSLLNALNHEEMFRKIDHFEIFNAERVIILNCLEELRIGGQVKHKS